MATAKRAYDGSPLWQCDRCGQSKKRKDMAEHGKVNTCNACFVTTQQIEDGDLRLPWLILPKAPEDVNQTKRNRILWTAIRPTLVKYRIRKNRQKVDISGLRRNSLSKLFHATAKVPEARREPVLKAMAGYDLDPKTRLWLAFREGIFDVRELRRLAVDAAEQAVQFVELAADMPLTHSVLTKLRRFLTEENTQTLNEPRNTAYRIQTELANAEYNRQAVHKAAQAMSAACFPNSRDAAIVATCLAYEALEFDAVDLDVALTMLSDLVRTIAGEALAAYALPELQPWRGPEEL